MSLLSRVLTSSHVVMNISVSIGCLVMSYFWYQNARSVQESRADRELNRQRYENMLRTEGMTYGQPINGEIVDSTQSNPNDNSL